MTPEFHALMRDATRLTQSGDLMAATAAIQAALGGASAVAERSGADADNDVIDVEAREVPSGRPAFNPAIEPAIEPAPEPVIHPPRPSAEPAHPAAASTGTFRAGHYRGAGMARDYKLYVPPQAAAGRPLPLVVMLHGCTQHPDDFAAGTRMNEAARAQGFLVLYPAQSAQANPQRCWNWFKHNHQARGRGEPELLAGMTREIMKLHGVDPARVYVAGLSAGGAMAAILGEAYPELYAAVGVHSGLAAGAAKDLPGALGAMNGGGAQARRGPPSGVPTIVFHGDADSTVHPQNAEHVIAAAAGARPHGPAARQRAPGGRHYTRRVHGASKGGASAEHWIVHGAAHAWSGGSSAGSYTDPQGPDATAEMVRFFLEHPRKG
jgi:poly(hydroxyalkanoate) depolymerase family esterase